MIACQWLAFMEVGIDDCRGLGEEDILEVSVEATDSGAVKGMVFAFTGAGCGGVGWEAANAFDDL